MMHPTDAIWLAAITAFSAVATATVNMIGSVLILYIRARYQYHETSDGAKAPVSSGNLPHT